MTFRFFVAYLVQAGENKNVYKHFSRWNNYYWMTAIALTHINFTPFMEFVLYVLWLFVNLYGALFVVFAFLFLFIKLTPTNSVFLGYQFYTSWEKVQEHMKLE